jgi:hypothetical protein
VYGRVAHACSISIRLKGCCGGLTTLSPQNRKRPLHPQYRASTLTKSLSIRLVQSIHSRQLICFVTYIYISVNNTLTHTNTCICIWRERKRDREQREKEKVKERDIVREREKERQRKETEKEKLREIERN